MAIFFSLIICSNFQLPTKLELNTFTLGTNSNSASNLQTFNELRQVK